MPHTATSASRQESRRRYFEKKQEARKARKKADRSSILTSEYSFPSARSSHSADDETLAIDVDGDRHRQTTVAQSMTQATADAGFRVTDPPASAPTSALGSAPNGLGPDRHAVPVITEDDMLAFQASHFGDYTKPNTFFIDAQLALNSQPWEEVDHLEDDGLGWYEDGVKRTLSDAQIALFRHSEMQQILREKRLQQEAAMENKEKEDNEAFTAQLGQDNNHAVLSDTSLEHSTVDVTKEVEPQPESRGQHQSMASHNGSGSSISVSRSRKREHNVPYNERKKRKWERYIERQDEEQGSMTHRRILRELDDQAEDKVDMDY